MAFVMEYGEHRFDISAVDYDRGWRLTGGGGGRDRVRHFELVDANDSSKHLSHCEFLTSYRRATEEEEKQHPGITDFHFYKFVGMGFVPGLDAEQSRAVFEEAIVAGNEHIREKVRSGDRQPFIEIFE